MRTVTKLLSGAAAAAALTVSAVPAQAQSWGHFRDRDGIDTSDILTGVAVLGGIAAIMSAFDRDGGRYGYANRHRYRNDYRSAVNSCAYEAQRLGGGRVAITDIDRRGANSYRVRGVVDAGFGSYGGYNRYDRYDRNGRFGQYDQRVQFACTARANGRVTDFDVNRYY